MPSLHPTSLYTSSYRNFYFKCGTSSYCQEICQTQLMYSRRCLVQEMWRCWRRTIWSYMIWGHPGLQRLCESNCSTISGTRDKRRSVRMESPRTQAIKTTQLWHATRYRHQTTIHRHGNVSNAEIMNSGDQTAFAKATTCICVLIVISYVGPDVDWLLSHGCTT